MKNKKTWTVSGLEIRSAQDGQNESPVISGYAAVYNSESELMYGFFREVIRPGAFDSSLSNDVRCLWNHDSSYVLGRKSAGTLDVRSDTKGLYFEVSPPNTQWANDLVESIRRKDIDQMSFGFMVNDDNWTTLEDGSEMRELLDVDLQEISVVTFPAYQATSAGVRSIDEAEDEIKERFEKRKKKKASGPDKRYYDYLRLIRAMDSKATDDGDEPGDDVDDPDDEDKRTKDDANGGKPLDPGSEADDPNDEDSEDDDEGDEDGSDDKK